MRQLFRTYTLVAILGLVIFSGSSALAAGETTGVSPELLACLRTTFGETRFTQMMDGSQPPTAAEISQGQACVSAHPVVLSPQPTISPSTSPTAPVGSPSPVATAGKKKLALNPEFRACLAAKIPGFESLDERTQPTEEMRKAAESCMAQHKPIPAISVAAPPALASGPVTSLSNELATCMEVALGKERFEAMRRGGLQPTPEEMAIAKDKCERHIPAPPLIDPAALRQIPDARPVALGITNQDKACFESVLGKQQAEAMMSGLGSPAPEQRNELMQKCFSQVRTITGTPHVMDTFERVDGGPVVREPQAAPAAVAGPMRECVIKVFGENGPSLMEKNQLPTDEPKILEMKNCMRRAYEVAPPPLPTSSFAPTGRPVVVPSGPGSVTAAPSLDPNQTPSVRPPFVKPGETPSHIPPQQPGFVPPIGATPSGPGIAPAGPPPGGVPADLPLVKRFPNLDIECARGILGPNFEAARAGTYPPTINEVEKIKATCIRQP